jgi:hypothetical protein
MWRNGGINLMRQFLVAVTETKYYLVETDNDNVTPEELANDFIAFDESQGMIHIVKTSMSPQTIEISEMSTPEIEEGNNIYGEEWL